VRMEKAQDRVRAAAALLALATVALFAGCGEQFSTIVVTAQVAKTLDPESNTASILVGKATVENIARDDWMQTPAPGDTTFGPGDFPAKVEQLDNATVNLNSENLPKRIPGVYFKAGLALAYLQRYDLDITTQDGKHVTAHAYLPDSFSIASPQDGDSVRYGTDTLRAAWTSSESCETYIVGVNPADSGSTAQGWSNSLTDTFCTVPASAFQDSSGNLVPGQYVFGVTAVNGGWNKSGLDLLLSTGNVDGAVGVFGCAVYPRPATISVR